MGTIVGTIDLVIRKLGKKNYSIDKKLSKRELFIILSEKAGSLLRGFYYRIFLKKCGGYLFVGKQCKIKHCHKITTGKTVIIGDNVEINALSISGVKLGNNVSIHRNTVIECTGVIRNLGEGIDIGNNVGISQYCFIQVRGKVIIGNDVMFGPRVSLFSEEHGFSDLNKLMIEQPEIRKGVTIENNVWIGAGATILDGVTIGEGSIVAAGSVVRHTVPPYSIVAGVPARVIRSRMSKDELPNTNVINLQKENYGF
jgi:acetyltransferase-like isoleucine patch superfamily enzyme